MIHEQLVVGGFQCNCHVLADDNGEAVIIDPGDDAEEVLKVAKDLKVKYLLHTHCHLDHITGTRAVAEATGAKIYIHEKDKPLYEMLPTQARMFGWNVKGPAPVDGTFADGDVFRFGKHELKVIHTPGHTPGSCCFHMPGELFSGDTLFQRSIGRTDLWGGNYQQEIESIQTRLFVLDAVVHPGHGPDTTIREEKEENPFLT